VRRAVGYLRYDTDEDTVGEEVKEKLRRTYEELNPFKLKREIDKITQELLKAYEKKTKKREKKTQKVAGKSPKDFPLTQNNFVYNLNEATRPSSPDIPT